MKIIVLLMVAVCIGWIGCSKPTEEQMLQQAVDLQKENKADEALRAFQDLIDTYPQSSKVPEALYAMAHLLQNDKREYRKAIELHRRIVAQFPQHATASSSSFLIGFIYNNELKDTAAARIAYEEYLAKYPDSPMASSARFELQTLGKEPAEVLRQAAPVAEQPSKKPVKKSRR